MSTRVLLLLLLLLLISGSSLTAQANQVDTLYAASISNQPEVGTGFDVTRATTTLPQPFKNLKTTSGHADTRFVPVNATSFSFDAHVSEATLEQGLSISGHASGRYGLISGSGSFSSDQSLAIGRNSFVVALILNKRFGYDQYLLQEGTEPVLTADADKALKGDPELFKQRYGSEWITHAHKGAHLVVVYEFCSMSREARDRMFADFNLKYRGGANSAEAGGSFEKWVTESKKDISVKVRVMSRGLTPDKELESLSRLAGKVWNPFAALVEMQLFLSAFQASSACYTSFATQPYAGLNGGISGSGDTWAALYDKYREARFLENDTRLLQAILRRRRLAEFPGHAVAMPDNAGQLAEDYLNTVKETARRFAAGEKVTVDQLSPPEELDSVSAYFMTSERWDLFTWLFLYSLEGQAKPYFFDLLTAEERQTLAVLLRRCANGGATDRIAVDLLQRKAIDLSRPWRDATPPSRYSDNDEVRDLKPLLALENVTTLNLAGQPIAELESLQRLTRLETLDLSHTAALSNERTLREVMDHPVLLRLTLKGIETSASLYTPNAHELGARIGSLAFLGGNGTPKAKLRVLDVRGHYLLKDFSAVKHVADTLQELYLDHTGIDDQNLQFVAQLKSLRKLSLAYSRRINQLKSLALLKPVMGGLEYLDITALGGSDRNPLAGHGGFAALGHDVPCENVFEGESNRHSWTDEFISFLKGEAAPSGNRNRFSEAQIADDAAAAALKGSVRKDAVVVWRRMGGCGHSNEIAAANDGP